MGYVSLKPRDDAYERDNAYEDGWLGEWNRVDPEVKHNQDRLHEYADDDETVGIHSTSRIRAFGKQGFNMGVQGLLGCTPVIMVSRRGVWMSHIWEVPSFVSKHPECWQHDVIPGIFEGKQYHRTDKHDRADFPGLNQYSIENGLFAPRDSSNPNEDHVVAAIIVTPGKKDMPIDWSKVGIDDEPFTQWKYAENVGLIRDALQQTYHIVPQVALYEVPTLSVPEKIKRLSTTGLGKVIVKYDPRKPGVILPDGRCSEQWAGLEVWVYGNPKEPFYWDTWHAYKDQRNPLWSRDDGNGFPNKTCPLLSDTSPTESASLMTSTTEKPSSTSGAITLTATTKAPITSCSPSTLIGPASGTVPLSTYSNCMCNDNQSGWPYTQTAKDGGRRVICFPDAGTPIITMSTIPPRTTSTREQLPDITSCSLNSYRVKYSTTIDGKATPSPSVISVCACDEDRQSTPFPEIDSEGFSTVLCNQRANGPTVAATVIGPCPTPTFAPFKHGKCTSRMSQFVDSADRDDATRLPLWVLSYAVKSREASEINGPDLWRDMVPLTFAEVARLPRCDTGFPYEISIMANIPGSAFHTKLSARVIVSANNTARIGLVVPPHLHREWEDWGVEIHAGDVHWASSKEARVHMYGKEKPGYCNMGDWERAPCRFETKKKRAMDCHWDC